MTFGLKCLLRGVGRDNEEAVIGTQLPVRGQATATRVGWRSLKDANRTASIWFRQSGKYFRRHNR
jgi:hypothetical protein